MKEHDATEQAYKNGYKDGYTDAMNGKYRSDRTNTVKIEITRKKPICPVCGKEMDETYLGRQYCKECEVKLKDENSK